MSTATSDLHDLEQKADAARARLLQVVDAIDARRHALKSPVAPPKRSLALTLALPVGATASGLGALVASALLPKRKRGLAFDAVLRSAGIALLSYGLFESLRAVLGLELGVKR